MVQNTTKQDRGTTHKQHVKRRNDPQCNTRQKNSHTT